uniref:Uncharacterized protein n=3 Tax=Vibrionaceae TaxID=641 RepID=A0A0H4A480_VIBSP|nr:hypothetical protein [Enterovibrio norvegicus]AKN40159.1 hypothetical protein [Vibrio sp. FF_482]AKN40671.1 hypothetical protein [Vibrio splendidus]
MQWVGYQHEKTGRPHRITCAFKHACVRTENNKGLNSRAFVVVIEAHP